MEITSTQWVEDLVEECTNAFVESNYAERWDKVEGYHTIGTLILEGLQLEDRKKTYGDQIVKRVAKSIKVSPRTVYNMVEFAKKFPDLALLPDGKNVSWTKIVKGYFPKSDEELPALLSRDDMVAVVKINAEFLVDNMKQNKRGISFFLPIAYVL